MLGRRASAGAGRRTSVQAGAVPPARTIDALVSNLDYDGTGRFRVQEVNSAIQLFNSLDNLAHITGGSAELPDGDQKPQMELCVGGQDGKVDKMDLERVMDNFAKGPVKTTVLRLVHVFQELCEIEWLFLLWAGSKGATLTHDDTVGPLKAFNKWSMQRHDPQVEGYMMISYYDTMFYGGTISFASFTRWIWENLCVLEEQFNEPFELTLGKLSECVESIKNGGEQVAELQRVKERCPWSGTLLPPRTLGAFLSNYSSDDTGRFNAEDLNAAITVFNGLDNLDHLLGGKGTFAPDQQPKVLALTVGQDGKVGQSDIQEVFQEYADRVLGGKLPQLIHAFQELQQIEWLYVTWSGDKQTALMPPEVQTVVKSFNKWSLRRHETDPRGLMALNNYDVTMYGHEITLNSFTRWAFEELCAMEEIFNEPFEVMLQVLGDCMQASKVMSCFQTWDTIGSNNIAYEAILKVLAELSGDNVRTEEIQAILEKAGRKDGVVDYRTFVETVMLNHLNDDWL